MISAKRFVWFLVFMLGLSLTVFVSVSRAEFGEPLVIHLSNSWLTPGDIVEDSDGSLHALWTETDVRYGIYYSNSMDGGFTWSEPTPIVTTSSWYAINTDPKLVIDTQGVFHLSYYYINYYGYSRVNYARSEDRGQTWSHQEIQGGRFSWRPHIDLDASGNPYLAWEKWLRTITPSVYFSRSTDNGLTWNTPSSTFSGGIVHNEGIEAQALLIDDTGRLHIIGEYPGLTYSYGFETPVYYRSDDGGTTWKKSTSLPTDFILTGIYQYAQEIFIVGSRQNTATFFRSSDWGDSFEGPFEIPVLSSSGYPTTLFSQIIVDEADRYLAWGQQDFIFSRDRGLTWSEPEYMGNAQFGKVLVTQGGDILAFGVFNAPSETGFKRFLGITRYEPPFAIDAPDYLSLWEKASFNYNFDVLGTGELEASFPAGIVQVDSDVSVSVGDQVVSGVVTTSEDRILVRFPVDAIDWTTCSLPITVKKGTIDKRFALQTAIADLQADLGVALESEDDVAAGNYLSDIRVLKDELYSTETEFSVTLQQEVGESLSDQTKVMIYNKLTSVYVHFKANPPEESGAELLLLSDNTISVGKSEPFNLEVKVTHLPKIGEAAVDIVGNAEIIDAIETRATGRYKTTHYLFYPPTFTNASDTLTIAVTVDGVTSYSSFDVILQ